MLHVIVKGLDIHVDNAYFTYFLHNRLSVVYYYSTIGVTKHFWQREGKNQDACQ